MDQKNPSETAPTVTRGARKSPAGTTTPATRTRRKPPAGKPAAATANAPTTAKASTKRAVVVPTPPRAKAPAGRRPAKNAAAAPVAPPAAKRPAAKPEKRVRDTFSLTATDLERLKTLKGAIATGGRKCTRSELLRAGLKLLASQNATAIAALLDDLPPLRNSKRK